MPDFGGRPTLKPEHAARVRDALAKLYRERFGENGTALARALKRSQSAVSALLAGKHQPSYETAERVAAMIGVTAAQLLGDQAAAGSEAAQPNLSEAIEWAESRGRASTDTIAVVRAAARHVPVDLDVLTWSTFLTAVESARGATAAVPAEPRRAQEERPRKRFQRRD